MERCFIYCLTVLEEGLKRNFKDVSVGVVDCPDLTSSPWCLAAPGNQHKLTTQNDYIVHVPPMVLYTCTCSYIHVLVNSLRRTSL